MKFPALPVLIICCLAANQAYAQDVSPQPLTRMHCDEAEFVWNENANVCLAESGDFASQPLIRAACIETGMVWNDNANVCEAAGETVLNQEPLKSTGQPLTRIGCEMAGLAWNDRANVCGDFGALEYTVLINIDKATQRMTVSLDGAELFEWPVSTGLPGFATPSGTYTASSMNQIWYSKEWDNAPMPHAVFFTKEGHAIHGTYEAKRLGRPASHGCVRLSLENASTLYELVGRIGLENTQVVLTGLTLGGEAKLARGNSSGSQYKRAARSYERYTKPRWRGRFFRRLFGRR
jgi:hypothetical protein